MKVHVLSLFPELLDQIFQTSILGRAQNQNRLQVNCHQIRDFSKDRHRSVDDYPYGGGAGMVMTPQPIFDAHEHVTRVLNMQHRVRTIYCTPKGRIFTQNMAKELAQEKALIFICGHYEGVDQRVIDALVTDEISIGDYVLTGGELPAAVMIDAIARMIPGVLKEALSFQEDSLFNGLLEHPHYTRPPVFRDMKVPEVLTSGHHVNIQKWRRYQSFRETYLKRPDLISNDRLTDEERQWLVLLKKK